MEKTPLLFDLNELPVDISEEPKDDVAPPLPFVVDLCFHKEDMEVVKQKYKVMSSSSSITNNDHFENLGFQGGCETTIHYRDKRVQINRNFPHAVGRSWLKEFTKKDEGLDSMVSLPKSRCPSKLGDNDKKKRKKNILDRLAAKVLLKDFVIQAKARSSDIKEKGEKEGPFCLCPRQWDYNKKTFVSMKRSSNPIIIIKKEHDA